MDKETRNEGIKVTTKDKVMQIVRESPDDISIEDIMERLLVFAKIDRGIKLAEQGEMIPHQAVKDRFVTWLK
ncbi:MAG: hypothetical protein ABIF71_06385 [Planctomycetota bacterium]